MGDSFYKTICHCRSVLKPLTLYSSHGSVYLSAADAIVHNATLPMFQLMKLFAASFAKISQRIHRAAIHHVAQFGESFVGHQISINNYSSNFVSIFNDRCRRERTHLTDHCIERDKLGDVGCIMDKRVRI